MAHSVSIREAVTEAMAQATAALQSREKVASETAPSQVPASDLGSNIRKLAEALRALPHEKVASETELSISGDDSFSAILRKTAEALREAGPLVEKSATLSNERIKSAMLALTYLQEPRQ